MITASNKYCKMGAMGTFDFFLCRVFCFLFCLNVALFH